MPPSPAAAGQHPPARAGGETGQRADTGRRFLALHLPCLATDRLGLPPETPVACWAMAGNRRIIETLSPAAAAAGLHPGQPVSDAQAILPDLRLVPADPAADRACLERLAAWALGLTPLVSVDPPDCLLLDMTGVPADAAGAALPKATERRLAAQGFAAVAALAANPAVALARARAGGGPPGDIPLAALRLPGEQLAALHRLGLRRLHDAAALPRGPLALRFGAELTGRLDALAGRRRMPLRSVRPPPAFALHLDFAEPLLLREMVEAAIRRLLHGLQARLAAAGHGTRGVVVRAFGVDGAVQEIRARSGALQRDPRYFLTAIMAKAGALQTRFGIARLALAALDTERSQHAQGQLARFDDAAGRRAALVRLVDHLVEQAPTWRPAPRAAHRPECSLGRADPYEPAPRPAAWPGPSPQPVRLLRKPVPLQVIAVLPDALPSALLRQGIACRVARAEGPERLAGMRWTGDGAPEAPRDYYRIELATGERFWIYREIDDPERMPMSWWLHGHFA